MAWTMSDDCITQDNEDSEGAANAAACKARNLYILAPAASAILSSHGCLGTGLAGVLAVLAFAGPVLC